jgi:apolipoprotein N-acyltransferase
MSNQRGRLVLWSILAVAGGWAWAAQFGARPYVLAPWFALAPLLLLLGSPWPARLGLLHGFAFWVAAIPWIASTLITYGQLAPWLGWLLFLLLAAYLALYWAAFAAIGARLWRRGGWVALLGLPALWVALEVVRDRVSGFPWNVANYAWVDVPGALPLASWVGPWGISFLVVFVNAGVAIAVARRRWQVGALGALVALAVLPIGNRFAHGTARPGAPQAVRLLQPNIANLVHYEPLPVLRNYARLLAMSRQACDVPGALVVWPESAGWPFDYPRDANFKLDVENLVDLGCPLLFNSAIEEHGGWRNAAFLLTPGGGVSRSDKRHLVPFGEYVPARKLFPFIERLARNAGDFSPAERVELLPWQRERLGVAICFEVIFPGEVAESVRRGATSLVTITNDAWFGDSAAPWQHFRAVRFRAAEERRPMLRAAITGVSALVRADGSVAAQLGPFEQGLLRGDLVGAVGLSPYARWPSLGPLLSVALAALALVAAWRGPSARSPHPGAGELPPYPDPESERDA